jgi:CubicO group peptidase (beta-lactamase class C family)
VTKPEDVGLSSERLKRVNAWAQRLVDGGRLAGIATMIARHGKVAHVNVCGLADIERETRMAPDTIFRLYSMTKPLTSTAIMVLYEEGHFQLDDPIKRFLPCFKDMRVYVGGMRGRLQTVPAERDITFRDLLTHTAGLTYGFLETTPVDAQYRDRGLDFQAPDGTLGDLVEMAADIPLIAQPGAEWNYSIATDVLGHLVAVISGKPFDQFLRERLTGPLGMVDTEFHVPRDKIASFAANYASTVDDRLMLLDDPQKSSFGTKPQLCSGGGGLVSTANDYLRFCQMMLNKGELDGVRLLGRKTVELMTTNHLRGDMGDMGQPRFSRSAYAGIGFGLGFAVMLDPAKAQILGTPGEYGWGGTATTAAFWIDPVEDMAVVMLTQLMPSSMYPIRRDLRVLTYQAVVD